MTYASIITPVADAPVVDAHLRAAAMLATAYGAVLIGSGAQFSLPPAGAMGLGGPYESGELAVLERTLVEDDLGAAEARFLGASQNVERVWRGSLELPVPALARRALLADLVVIGDMPADRNDIVRYISIEDAVMKAGRPVLRVPACGMSQEPRTVAVAWKDTRQARRAVADALPFLTRAETVLIYSVAKAAGRDAANESMADLMAYLARHDIKTTAVCLLASDAAGDELLRAAAQSGSDLIVAGASGRSHVETWMFGGVTRTLLSTAQTPVLFSC